MRNSFSNSPFLLKAFNLFISIKNQILHLWKEIVLFTLLLVFGSMNSSKGQNFILVCTRKFLSRGRDLSLFFLLTKEWKWTMVTSKHYIFCDGHLFNFLLHLFDLVLWYVFELLSRSGHCCYKTKSWNFFNWILKEGEKRINWTVIVPKKNKKN